MTCRDLRPRLLAFVCVTTLQAGCHHRRWVEPPLEPATKARWHEGQKYLLQHKSDEGCEALRQAIVLQPEQPYAYRDMRIYCTKDEQFGFGLSVFQDVVNANDNNAVARSFVGDTLIDMHRWIDAIEAYKKLIRFAPDSWEIHYTLGALYLEAGDKDGALGEYEELIHMKIWSWPYSLERHMYDRRAKQLLECIDTGKIVVSRAGGCSPDM